MPSTFRCAPLPPRAVRASPSLSRVSLSPGLARILTVLCAVLVALVSGCGPLAPLPAGAGLAEGWRKGAGHEGEMFVGQFRNRDGVVSYCADATLGPPWESQGYQVQGQGTFRRTDGVALSEHENQAVSYLLKKWGATDDRNQAAAVQLGLWSVTTAGMGWGTPKLQQMIQAGRVPQEAVAQAKGYLDEAFAQAGPYSIVVAQPDPDHTEVTLRNRHGAPAPGWKVTARSSGDRTVDGPRSTWDSAAQPHRLEWKRTGYGEAKLSVSADNLPGELSWFEPRNPRTQRILMVTGTSSATGELTSPAEIPFEPKVVTKTSSRIVEAGQPVKDVLVVGPGGKRTTWPVDHLTGQPVAVSVRSTLWGPLDTAPQESPEPPAGTPKAGEVETVVRGAGEHTTPEVKASGPGYYVWTESIDPAGVRPEGARPVVAPWKGRFGLVPETSVVRWPVGMRTQVSTLHTVQGKPVTDKVWVEGIRPEQPQVTVRLSLRGPLPALPLASPSVPALDKVPQASEVSFAVRNGENQSPAFPAITRAGCYTIVTHFQGSDYNLPFTSGFGEPTETFCVDEKLVPTPAPTSPAAPPSPQSPTPSPHTPVAKATPAPCPSCPTPLPSLPGIPVPIPSTPAASSPEPTPSVPSVSGEPPATTGPVRAHTSSGQGWWPAAAAAVLGSRGAFGFALLCLCVGTGAALVRKILRR